MGQVTHEITLFGRNKWNNHSHLSSDFWGFYCMRIVVATCPFLAVCIPAALRAGASGKSLLLHSQQQNTFGVGTYLVVEAG